MRKPARFFWPVAAAFTAHVVEELPSFPRWATRHFGTTTTEFYVATHAVLLPAVIGSSAAGATGLGGRLGRFAAAAVASVMVTNSIYHVGTTALFREYSPGLVTAVVGMLPAGAYALWRTHHEELLTDEQLLGAFLTGNAIALGAVSSLYLDMPKLGGEARE